MNKPPIVIIAGPTCGGKTTLEAALHVLGFQRLVSYTTRAPRDGEHQGVAYHFTTEATFDSLIDDDNLVEWERFGSARYGLGKGELERAIANGAPSVIVMEPRGVSSLIYHCQLHDIPTVPVWVDCDAEVRAQRFLDRVAVEPRGAAKRLASMITVEPSWKERVPFFISIQSDKMAPMYAAEVVKSYVDATGYLTKSP